MLETLAAGWVMSRIRSRSAITSASGAQSVSDAQMSHRSPVHPASHRQVTASSVIVCGTPWKQLHLGVAPRGVA